MGEEKGARPFGSFSALPSGSNNSHLLLGSSDEAYHKQSEKRCDEKRRSKKRRKAKEKRKGNTERERECERQNGARERTNAREVRALEETTMLENLVLVHLRLCTATDLSTSKVFHHSSLGNPLRLY